MLFRSSCETFLETKSEYQILSTVALQEELYRSGQVLVPERQRILTDQDNQPANPETGLHGKVSDRDLTTQQQHGVQPPSFSGSSLC